MMAKNWLKKFLHLFIVLLFLLLLPWVQNSQATDNQPIAVLVSFSILADLAKQLGGRHIQLNTLVGVNEDMHIYRPKPSNVQALKKTDLLISNGLNFEPWLARLVRASHYQGDWLIANLGITPLVSGTKNQAQLPHKKQNDQNDTHHPPNVDPHAWQNLKHIRQYAHNITQAFIKHKPSAKADFIKLNRHFITQVKQLEQLSKSWFAKIPKKRRIVITNHDAFGYIADEFDIIFLAPIGISTQAQASASAIAKLIKQIKKQQVQALFLDNISNPKILKQISKETNTKIGGQLYSDSLPIKDNQPLSYLEMMHHNLYHLSQALK